MNPDKITIAYLLKEHIAFMGSDWDESGNHRGKIPFVNCNDVFHWGHADGEYLSIITLPDLIQSVRDCNGDISTGAILYCARRRGMRPQGAMYTFIPRHFWRLFDACGPERGKQLGNPYLPGEYKPELIKD